MSEEKASSIIIEGKGKHFDPLLVDLFEKIHFRFEMIAAKEEK